LAACDDEPSSSVWRAKSNFASRKRCFSGCEFLEFLALRSPVKIALHRCGPELPFANATGRDRPPKMAPRRGCNHAEQPAGSPRRRRRARSTRAPPAAPVAGPPAPRRCAEQHSHRTVPATKPVGLLQCPARFTIAADPWAAPAVRFRVIPISAMLLHDTCHSIESPQCGPYSFRCLSFRETLDD
jgi:hypothetical protein